MGMGLGNGFAAAEGAGMLQDILRDKFAQALALKQQKLAEQRMGDEQAYRQASLASLQGARDDAANTHALKQQQDAAQQATAGNQAQLRSAIQGSQNMAGTDDPNGAAGTRNALRVALTASGAKGNEIPQEPAAAPKPKLYAVTVPGPNGQPIHKLVSEEAMQQGVQGYKAPVKADKPAAPSIFYGEDGKPHALQYGASGYSEVALPPTITGRTAPKAAPKTTEQIAAEAEARARGGAKGRQDAGGGGLLDKIASVFGGGDDAPTVVKMRAPNGQERDVPADQVEHYKALGAVEVK